jgi:hypothetical protein
MLNSAVGEINQIHELYDQFFASVDGNPSYLANIETKLATITTKYTAIFEANSPNKVEEIEQALEKVKAYHAELLEGTDSIKADIEDSQKTITDFYNKLFSKSDGTAEDGGQKTILENAIKSITDFDSLLNNSATGYKFSIESAKSEILKAHSELFAKAKGTGKSASDLLNEKIAETTKFHEEVKGEIVPFLKEQKTDITKIATDIKNKQAEVDSLLSNATVNTLAQGYAESMQTYGSPIRGKFPQRGEWKRTFYILSLLWSQPVYFIKFLASYFLFIGPLAAIGALFVVNNTSIFGIDLATKSIDFSGTEYILYKLTIALPLLWVSWFGQRSISHRKRLFEEYNHKLRVVQMYMLFTAQKETYTLSDKAMESLQEELLKTIGKNPSQVYGKDETMIDKLISIFSNRKNNRGNSQNDESNGQG